MKPGMYLRPAGRRYLFSHPKYEARHVPEVWPVASTCFPTQNMKREVYLWPVPIYPTKIWGAEAWPVAGTCFPIQNMKRRVYLRPVVAGTCFRFSACKNRIAGAAAAGVSGRLQVPVFAFPLVKIVMRGQQNCRCAPAGAI